VLPVLGLIEGERPVDWRRSCGRTCAAFAAQTGLGPGSSSAGLDELLALLGARADAGDAAVDVLARLTVVRGCGHLARTATERLGRVLAAAEAQTVAAGWAGRLPPLAARPPARRYGWLDGLLVHPHAGWTECKLGAVDTPVTAPGRHRPEALGRLLGTAAARWGVLGAVGVIGSGAGAPWLWKLVAEHCPGAVQMGAWGHARQ
jgi:hypothetical protein